MKRLIIRTFLFFISFTIFSMEEKPNKEIGHIFSQLDPELQLHVIEQGIIARLNGNLDPIEAIIDAFKYLDSATATNRFLLSNKIKLKNKLKDLAKEKFAPEYARLSPEELNGKLNEAMYKLETNGKNLEDVIDEDYGDIRRKISNHESPERDEIVKLIIAGANPNFNGTNSIYSITGERGLLQQAIGFEDIKLVRLLIAYKASVKHSDGGGLNPLRSAIFGHMRHSDLEKAKKIMELLIKHGADVNERSFGLNLPIHRAIFGAKPPERPAFLEMLLGYGAKLDDAEIKHMRQVAKDKPKEYIDVIKILKEYGYEI